MISGARELMTPGAWEKHGATYQLTKDEPSTAEREITERYQAIEAVVAITEIEIVGIRLKPIIATVLDSVEALRLRHIPRVQDKGIHDTKNHSVCAYGQCQG